MLGILCSRVSRLRYAAAKDGIYGARGSRRGGSCRRERRGSRQEKEMGKTMSGNFPHKKLDDVDYVMVYQQDRGNQAPFRSIKYITARATALAPSLTASLSSDRTRRITRPSNLSGWKRNISSLSTSFRVLPFPSSELEGKRNADMVSAVTRKTSILPCTGHGTSPKPRFTDFDLRSSTQRRS